METEKLSYIAGFFDGEGCVYINSGRGKNFVNHQLVCQIANTNKNILVWIQNYIKLGTINRKSEKRENCKLAWNWRVVNNQAVSFLQMIEPYLKIKRIQAKVALEFVKTKIHLDRVENKSEEIEKREWYQDELARLKFY